MSPVEDGPGPGPGLGLRRGEDGVVRCGWAGSPPEYLAYHDDEWGRPVHGEQALFERITLEAFQSGLSWLTILRKRDNFRAAFAGFDPTVVATYGTDDVERLLSDAGIVGLADPSGLFLSSREVAVSGTCVTVTLEGRRPLVAEIQGLVTASTLPTPRRATHGLDASRIAMILAVLQQRAGAQIGGKDAYVATVGGVKVTEPAADLAIALAVASALRDEPFPSDGIAFGEIGLAGEVRAVTLCEQRLAEAARLEARLRPAPVAIHDDGDVTRQARRGFVRIGRVRQCGRRRIQAPLHGAGLTAPSIRLPSPSPPRRHP